MAEQSGMPNLAERKKAWERHWRSVARCYSDATTPGFLTLPDPPPYPEPVDAAVPHRHDGLCTAGETRGFVQGLAWAVQILAARGEDTFAGELIRESGLTAADFDAAAVDEHDMQAVRKIQRSERV